MSNGHTFYKYTFDTLILFDIPLSEYRLQYKYNCYYVPWKRVFIAFFSLFATPFFN